MTPVNEVSKTSQRGTKRHGQLISLSLAGTLCAVVAAVGYTAANCCLRAAADLDPIWVSCVKAFPTVIFSGAIVTWGAWRGHQILPSGGVILGLIAAGLFGQLGGNVVFQWSLGVIGIGLTVPLCLGMIILASAVLARMTLGEAVTPQSCFSMVLLIVAIWVLSLGAGDAYRSIARQTPDPWIQAAGVAAACFSGFAYAVLGVVLRYAVMQRASVGATTFIVAVVGLVALGSIVGWQPGWDVAWGTPAYGWLVMAAAGIFNLVAFWALTKALQLTTLVYVNAVNASQVAMAAIAGVILFHESLTAALFWGVALTVAGLLLMPRNRPVSGDHERHRRVEVTERDKEPMVQKSRNCSSSATSCKSIQRENSASERGDAAGAASTTCSSPP